jgi:hypothetical protein
MEWTDRGFDLIIHGFDEERISFSEAELLCSLFWNAKEPALLREDLRFKQTPWKRWILSSHFLVNDTFSDLCRDHERSKYSLSQLLKDYEVFIKRPCVFCPADPRFVLQNDELRLAATELSKQPLVEEAAEFEKYITHLPLNSLKAVAASEPLGQWGPHAQEETVDVLGWVKVKIPGRKLNDRMFVAQIQGQSMDDGKSGLVDRKFAVFELWPEGTRQNKNVLVRGSFNDPETGSYTFKKYVADQRDSEGYHHEICLVSLNPDKILYPDIVLQPETDDDLTIIAQFIDILDEGSYSRKPKKQVHKSRRDISSAESLNSIKTRLEKATSSFFESDKREGKGKETSEELSQSRWVCFSAENGGLHIEIDPLSLPKIAKILKIYAEGIEQRRLASNLRHRPTLIPFIPQSSQVSFSIPGFEQDFEEEMNSLTLRGLSENQVTVFKVGSDDRGALISDFDLTLGQEYRIIVPPNLDLLIPDDEESHSLKGGWMLWELSLSGHPTEETNTLLSQLGLNIKDNTSPQLSWQLVSPIRYERTVKQEQYPCFKLGSNPLLKISGMQTQTDGEASVFLSVNHELRNISLPEGNGWWLEIDDLPVGKYLLDVHHSRKRFEIEKAAFAIVDGQFELPSAKPKLHLMDDSDNVEERTAETGQVTRISQGDLTQLDFEGWNIIAPPFWNIHHFLQTNIVRYFPRIEVGSSGDYSLAAQDNLIKNHIVKSSHANWCLNLEELGQIQIEHDRGQSPEHVQKTVIQLLTDRGGSIDHLLGSLPELKQSWLEPLLMHLGYRLESLSPAQQLETLENVALFTLHVIERKQDQIIEEPCYLLIWAPNLSEFQDSLSTTKFQFIHNTLSDHGLWDSIITDGKNFMMNKRGSQLTRKTYDVIQALDDDIEFKQFLANYAYGV